MSTPVPNSSATAQRMRATIGGAGRRGGAALSASYWAAAGAVARRRAKLSALAILVDFFCVALREAPPPSNALIGELAPQKKKQAPAALDRGRAGRESKMRIGERDG